MSDLNVSLNEVRVKNYLSLRDVTVPLKQLTVLVGPNASGKSNVLTAFKLLTDMMNFEDLPSAKFIQRRQWAGKAENILV